MSSEREGLISRLLKGGYIVYTITIKNKDTGEIVKTIIDIFERHDNVRFDEWTGRMSREIFISRLYSTDGLKRKTERLLKGK